MTTPGLPHSGVDTWHPGEVAIQSQLQFASVSRDAYELFTNSLPAEHRAAHAELRLLPLVTLDQKGRPWVSISTSPSGAKGFVSSPAENIIAVESSPLDGDPILDNLQEYTSGSLKTSKVLVAGLAVNLDSIGIRNKFSGFIKELCRTDSSLSIIMEVTQRFSPDKIFSNHNSYLTTRCLDAYNQASPSIVYRKTDMRHSDRIPEELIAFIQRADSAFFGTSYVAAKKDELKFPSHLGLGYRGGLPGFLRVRRSDGKTIVFPDYSGNQIMNSLGNIEATPIASFTIPCFTTGDVLYLTGTARNYVGNRAQSLMPRVNLLTAVKITGYIYIRDALPLREREGSRVRSPYCPPIRLLAEEKPYQTFLKGTSVKISRVVLKTPDCAVFTFDASKEITIRAGEWARLDFSSYVGRPGHPLPTKSDSVDPRDLNDDRKRTWTVSSFHTMPCTSFDVTVQKQPNGRITTYLLDLAHRLTSGKTDTIVHVDDDDLPGGIGLVSIGGDFLLQDTHKKLLWIAGGAGITPFISLLQEIQQKDTSHDVKLILATRFPDIHLSLLTSPLTPDLLSRHRIAIHVFSGIAPTIEYLSIDIQHHSTRFERDTLKLVAPDVNEREIWVCGSSAFSAIVLESLIERNADVGSVRRESFWW